MKKDKIDYVVSIDEEAPLFDCIFTAGLYHDRTTDEYVPFTRDCFPEEVSTLYPTGFAREKYIFNFRCLLLRQLIGQE